MSDGQDLFDNSGPASEPVTIPGPNAPGTLGTIDQYVLKRKIGGGGFGVVYLAEDSFSHVKYALKTIHPALKQNPEEMRRLKENFAIVQKLHHPHIADAMVIHLAHDVQYFTEEARKDLRLASGDPVMVMSYAPGSTLSAWRSTFPGKRVPVDKAAEICRQVADALDYAHAQRVIHRDVKPANVVVSEDRGRIDAQVLDFGLAAEIRSSINPRGAGEVRDTSGTRPYMAPEQWTGDDQNGRTDQYALAVMLYELVSGAVPFEGVFRTGDVELMLDAVKRRPPLSVRSLSSSQNRALRKALAKAPGDRFPSCAAFVAAFSGRATPSSGSGSGSLRDSFLRSLSYVVPFLRSCCGAAADAARRAACAGADRSPRFRAVLDRLHLLPESFFAPEDDAEPPASAPAFSGGLSAGTGPRTERQVRKPVVTPVDLGDGLSFDMADLPPGSFLMGSPHSEPGRRPGESLHEVSMSPFQLAAAPVTRGKWRAVTGTEPPPDPNCRDGESDDCPATGLSWDDCESFFARLNRDHPVHGYEWRLPTEAQWEYACRAGSSAPYGGTGRIEDMGWYAGNSGGAPHPVRGKRPNDWGLYDMNGGVWEWCVDEWTPSLGNKPSSDPVVAGVGRDRVVRGGSWAHSAALARSASRMKLPRTARFDNVGFRVALVPR